MINQSISLDEKIILYSNNMLTTYMLFLDNINNKKIESNVWQVSSKNNANDTDITSNSEIFYIPSFDNFLLKPNYNFLNNVDAEKAKLKVILNENVLSCIVDYINRFDLKIKTIKDWTICKNIFNSSFHDDMSRNKYKHNYTIIVALNDGYQGGEFQFENRIGNELITMTTGQVLIYPSSNEYRHKEFPVTSGTKYNAITYF
jgi:hypothetical protein